MSNIKPFLLVMGLALNSTLARGADNPGELPFKLVQGFGIVVRGEIGSAKDMNFLLDTGAVPSVLGQRAAAQLGIRGERGSLTLLNRESQAEYVTVDDVQVGWIRAARLPMVVVELAPRRLGTRIDAIVGLDMLVDKTSALTISIEDYPRVVGFLCGTRWMGNFHRCGCALLGGSHLVGGVEFRVLLDTGANDLALPARAQIRLGLSK